MPTKVDLCLFFPERDVSIFEHNNKAAWRLAAIEEEGKEISQPGESTGVFNIYKTTDEQEYQYKLLRWYNYILLV